MRNFKIKLYDLKWIYDTILPSNECIKILTNLQGTNPYSWSAVICNQQSENLIELTFRQPASGEGKPKRTRYTAEFFKVETGVTVIVLRFVDELFGAPPFTSIDEIDAFFHKAIHAFRRQ